MSIRHEMLYAKARRGELRTVEDIFPIVGIRPKDQRHESAMAYIRGEGPGHMLSDGTRAIPKAGAEMLGEYSEQ